MEYALLFVNTEADWESNAEREAIYAKIGAWFGELGAAGKIVGGEELQGADTATTVRLRDSDAMVTDGPFVESKEVIGGFAILEVADLDEALKIAKSWPAPNATLEISPVVAHEA